MSEPTPPSPDTQAEDDRLADLTDDFLRRYRAGERPSVDECCAKHPELADRIRDLLAAVIAMEQRDFALTADVAPAAERVGSTIGRYKLLQRIGEGGFGVVYMAEQLAPVRRKVALKVIKPGVDTRQVIARFEAERQALALMDHENIAKVFDAGATDAGRPYFVMELVHGVPITEFCDKSELPPRERLELFVKVCRAVQHAHTKGVVHRDIKPTNVLVTLHEGVPVPKVIDFGVAKATGQQLTEKTLFTNFAQMVGTPLYMSPEQAEMTGIDVDTRADVYSLGVLLYELLTGTTPVDRDRLKQAAFDEVLRIIREEEPPRPSTRLSTMGEESRRSISSQRGSDPRQLGQLFRRELDWIVMKAMEKDRSRRYETANALAVDVRHFLENEPVSARPASALYRLRKLAVKYKVGFGAAAAVAAALVLGVAGTTLMTVRATKARDRAVTLSGQLDQQRREALGAKARAEEAKAQAELDRAAMKASEEEARAALKVFDNMLTASDPERHDPDVTVRQMVDRAVAQVDRRQPASPARVEGAIRETLGTAYEGLGRFSEAETQFRKALGLRQAALSANHPAVAQNLGRLGALLVKQKRFEEALPLLEQSLRIYRSANVSNSDVSDALTWLQHVSFAMGRFAEADQYAHENTELRARSGVDATELRIANAFYEAYGRIARGDFAGAERVLREGIELDRQVRKGNVDRRLITMYHNLGAVLERQGRAANAEAAFRQALAASEKLLGPDHLESEAALAGLAGVLRAQGRAEEARALEMRRLGIQTRAVSDAIGDKSDNTNLYRDRAHLLCRAGRFKEAIADFDKAIELDPGDHWKYFMAAPVYLYAGDVEGYHRLCRQMVQRFGASEVPEVGERVAKASLLEPDPQGDIELFARLIERAMAQGNSHPYLDWFKTSLALAECRRGRLEQAVKLVEGLPEHGQMPVYGRALAGLVLAMAQAKSGRLEEARVTLADAEAKIDPRWATPGDSDLGEHFSNWCTYQVIRSQARSVVNAAPTRSQE